MRTKNLLVTIASLFLLQNYLLAQDKPNIKFGKISPEDFNLSKHSIDSNADAVVIADIGDAHYVSDYTSLIKFVYTRHRRMKIISRRGVHDAANVSIPIYLNGMHGQRMTSLKAVTYNLENGHVVETKLDEKNVYDDRVISNYYRKKFAFPGVKEGSIIEFSIEIESPPMLNIPSWEFQGRYPCLWSEYSISIPEYFNFDFFPQGNLSFYINQTGRDNFNLGPNILSVAATHHWVMKDVPAIKIEPFTTTFMNHIARIEFQLSELRLPAQKTYNINTSWPQISHDMMESEYFGSDLNRNNGWLDDDLRMVVQNKTSKLEQARSVYFYLRNHFACKEESGIGLNKSLKTVFKEKSGSEAEINLLLVAMLNHVGIHSSPVILSTRNNGYVNPVYPILSKFNYTICEAEIDGNDYYLDASNANVDFNALPEYCYNGFARVIEKETTREIAFLPDSVLEKKITSVFIINDSLGMPTGSYQSVLGKDESFELRESLKKQTRKEYFEKLKTDVASDMSLENMGIDSVSQPEFPVTVHYDFNLKLDKNADILYVNPMLMEARKENPFKSAARTYPVEMPHTFDDVYTCTMEIPAGYNVEELPKSEKIEFSEGNGFFEYIVTKSDTEIQFRSRIKLGRAIFMPEDYNTLREFFGAVVKKQSEQIVFRKKK